MILRGNGTNLAGRSTSATGRLDRGSYLHSTGSSSSGSGVEQGGRHDGRRCFSGGGGISSSGFRMGGKSAVRRATTGLFHGTRH